jgi:hypothetical protein
MRNADVPTRRVSWGERLGVIPGTGRAVCPQQRANRPVERGAFQLSAASDHCLTDCYWAEGRERGRASSSPSIPSRGQSTDDGTRERRWRPAEVEA